MKAKRLLTVLMALAMAGGVCCGVFAGCSNNNVEINNGDKNPDDGDKNPEKPDDGDKNPEKPDDGDKNPEKPDDGDGENKEPAETNADAKIYLVGDSTVCSYIKEDGTHTDNYYIPRYGYGTQISQYFDVKEENVVNLAISGRSSKSFLTEDNYKTLTSSITKGDYLIIGFGHNDEKMGEAETYRYTNPTKTYTDSSEEGGISFQYTLYENYVKLATEKGATPVLCTPIVRYNASANYDGSSGHIVTGQTGFAGGDYAQAIRTLASETKTALVDLTKITKEDYTAKGEEALLYHAASTYKGDGDSKVADGYDTTHINMFGAKMVAYEIADAIKSTDCSLKNLVKADIKAPTKAADYAAAINTAFVKPEYSGFNPEAYEDHHLTGAWHKTIMGDVGGADKFPNFSVSYESGKFAVSNTAAGNGKFAGGSDGFAAAFMQIDATKDFEATATMKVISMGKDNQSGFGMMLRDDIFIDLSASTVKSDYVTAGYLNTKGAFLKRISGARSNGSAVADLAAGSVVEIGITKTGNSYTLKFGSLTETVDNANVVEVDKDYVYLCLFANRAASVEFTDVQVTIK